MGFSRCVGYLVVWSSGVLVYSQAVPPQYQNQRQNKQQPVVTVWAQWSDWGGVTPNCQQFRKRVCRNDGGRKIRPKFCKPDTITGLADTDSQTCTEQDCCKFEPAPTDDPTQWSTWSTCSTTCGRGTQTRTKRTRDDSEKIGYRRCDRGPCQAYRMWQPRNVNGEDRLIPIPESGSKVPVRSTRYHKTQKRKQKKQKSLIEGRSGGAGSAAVHQNARKRFIWKPQTTTRRPTKNQDKDTRSWPVWNRVQYTAKNRGRWTVWQEWSSCSTTCREVDGIRTRTRRCGSRRQYVPVENCIGKKDKRGNSGAEEIAKCKVEPSCIGHWSANISEMPMIQFEPVLDIPDGIPSSDAEAFSMPNVLQIASVEETLVPFKAEFQGKKTRPGSVIDRPDSMG